MGTACRVRHHHPVSEKLGQKLNVGRLAAPGTGAGKLKQRLFKLASLHGKTVKRILFLRQRNCIIPQRRLFLFVRQQTHLESLFLRRADIDAVAAAGTVIGRDSHTEL